MSRSIRFTLAAFFALAGSTLAYSQNGPNDNPPATLTSSSATAGDDVATLKAENATLKKEVADAKQTIAKLQAQLAKAGKNHHAATATASAEPEANPPVAVGDASATPAIPAQPADASLTNAPTGPLKALPLDATNAVANAATPGADAGPSRSYTVVKGDSLWKIAHKMYPHDTLNGEDKIREANKDVFNGKFLQPGQVLVIPQ